MSNFNQEAYDRAISRRDLVRTDLEELAQQVEDGEIDGDTAAGLKGGYEAELAAADKDLSKLGTSPKPKKDKAVSSPESTKRTPSENGQPAASGGGLNYRLLVGAGILVVALVVIIFSVQNSSEPEPTAGPIDANAAQGSSCAELEDVLEQHPGNEFRLVVADCYVDTGDAMSAIGHFQGVLASNPTIVESAAASFGLGFLNMQIGQVVEASEFFKTATETDSQNYDAKYWYGMMLIYELDRPTEGVPYLEDVLTLPSLAPDTVASIEEAIAVARGDGAGS